MGNDAALRSCLLVLAAVMAVVGLCTFSIKKVMATYAYGVVGIAGVLLPDWEYFDRDFSQWFTPMTATREPASRGNPRTGRLELWFKFHPLRVTVLTIIYCFGLYKWWMFVSS
ncbi:signal peptidase complex subunit 1 [Apostasia shenzhenica]|uniref:Signal peptidase complex subunit 1 n=1 Tax=Apostasia shenzhenica TaxID=1088818 RepID=A0A2I0AVA4_9ASPA|nr:signal peptidase complex subunit 1 [Apostasia shenzhenica]